MAGLVVTRLVPPVPLGGRFLTVSSIAFDSSFASGGEALTRADLGFLSNADASFAVIVPTCGGFPLEYDYTNQKLLAYWQSDSDNNVPLTPADTADLSLLTAIVVAIGKYHG